MSALDHLPAATGSWSCPWFLLVCVICSAVLGVLVGGEQPFLAATTGFAFGFVVGARRPKSCQT